METRKIQKTGVATYTVSLPKPWILKNNLKSGDRITLVEEEDQSLRITLDEKQAEEKEATIRIKDLKSKDEILRKLTARYLEGATRISLIFETPIPGEVRRAITLSVKRFMGFEIVEESEDRLILQDFFTSDNLSLIKAVKRELNISKLVIEESRKILRNEVENLENLSLWENEVDKLYLLVRRQINFAIHNSNILRKFNITLKECQDMLLLTDSIEKITDSFFIIGENALKIEKISESSLKKLDEVLVELLTSYDMAFEGIMKKDFNISVQALEKIKKIHNYSVVLEKEKLNDKSKVHFYLLVGALHTSSTYLEEIAEIGLGAI